MKILASFEKMRMWSLMLAVLGASFTSCSNILDEENVDCSVEYRVKFKYDHNMKFADAFANEVRSVTLYAFDQDGKFVYQRTEQGDILGEDGYTMPVEVEAGDYRFITWAGLEGDESFSVPVLTPGVSTIDELTCRMNRTSTRSDGTAIVTEDLKPLWHGDVVEHSFTSRAATEQVLTVPLIKNTNNVRIVLQHLSGSPVEVDKFTFTITDRNGWMDYDNSLLEDEKLTYYAWRTDDGVAELNPDGSRAQTSIGVAIAELTVGRLVLENDPILTITNDLGEKVLSIPLIDYALLVKGHYNRNMDNQEYLDRQDEFNMTFFLDEDDTWVDSYIIINSWKVVLNNEDLN